MTINSTSEQCRLFFTATGIPVSAVSENRKILFQFSGMKCGPIQTYTSIIKEFDLILRSKIKTEHVPIIQITKQHLLFGAVRCKEIRDGFLLLGPVPHIGFSESLIPDVLRRHNLPDRVEYYNIFKYELPRMTSTNFAGFCSLMYFYEWGITPEIPYIMNGQFVEEPEGYTFYSQYISSILNKKESKLQTIPIEDSKLLIKYIMEGNISAAVKHFEESTISVSKYKPYFAERLAKYVPETPSDHDDLTIALISFFAFASHIAEKLINNGFDDKEGWMLWYYYVSKAFRLTTIVEINSLKKGLVVDFSERYALYAHVISSKMQKCLISIKEHLNEDITITSLSMNVGLSPRYLTEMFKKEIGMSINRYIQRERITAAKTLLAYTTHSLVEISGMMNFSSQSYFSSTFKKFTGFTPQGYRDRFRR